MNSSGIPGMALHQAISFFSPMMSVPETPAVFWPGCALLNLDPSILKKIAGDPCSDGARDPAGSRLLRPALFFPVSGKISGIQEKAGTPAEKKRGKKDLHRLSQLYPPASWDLRDPGDPHLVRPGRDHDPEGPLRTREGMPGSWRNSAALYLARSLSHPERSGRSAGGPGPFTSFRVSRSLSRSITGPRTLCCGNFHMLHTLEPEKSARMRARRLEEFPADRIILSSCQGCLGSFKGQGRETLHLLELLFGKSRKQGWKNRIFVTLCPGIVLRSR